MLESLETIGIARDSRYTFVLFDVFGRRRFQLSTMQPGIYIQADRTRVIGTRKNQRGLNSPGCFSSFSIRWRAGTVVGPLRVPVYFRFSSWSWSWSWWRARTRYRSFSSSWRSDRLFRTDNAPDPCVREHGKNFSIEEGSTTEPAEDTVVYFDDHRESHSAAVDSHFVRTGFEREGSRRISSFRRPRGDS